MRIEEKKKEAAVADKMGTEEKVHTWRIRMR